MRFLSSLSSLFGNRRLENELLRAMLAGQSLRSHRTLEGEKAYRLHQLDGQSVLIKKETVDALRRKRLIETNNKFPTATYFLTGKGRETASKLTDSFDAKPLTGRGDSAH